MSDTGHIEPPWPVRLGVFGTSWVSLFALGIAYAQRWAWPLHVGIVFELSNGYLQGFEARRAENAFVPFCYAEKRSAYNGHWGRLRRRRLEERWLNVPAAAINAGYAEANRLRAAATRYASDHMMVWKLLHERRGWPMPATDAEVDCSESAARILCAAGVDLRSAKNPVFDAISPAEVWAGVTGGQYSVIQPIPV